MPDLLLSFVGDDFTGSTDAMESLARAGVPTVLFTRPPTAEQLARHPGIRAIGVAGQTRAMSPSEMERALRPTLSALKKLGPPTIHYKVCSTFDSSPTIGNIGRVVEIGLELFDIKLVPIVVGAPALGRYCVFGNLFARSGKESEPFRLDRHPSMSRHPTTPMDEADLRLHLAKQTSVPIELMDVLAIESNEPTKIFDLIVARENRAVLIDLLYERQLPAVGSVLAWHGNPEHPLFVIGSSGIESALTAHWHRKEIIGEPCRFASAGPAGPIIAVCGSCSPVTAAQIGRATDDGFVEVPLSTEALSPAIDALRSGKSVVVHSRNVDPRLAANIGPTLGAVLRDLLSATRVRRVLVAGGDTSGQIARALGIESMEMVAELTRGSPLCRVSAPGSPADGIEMTFKGGQIGKVDFFSQVQQGISDV